MYLCGMCGQSVEVCGTVSLFIFAKSKLNYVVFNMSLKTGDGLSSY